ncbi:MAG: hypothetical protein ACR2IE_02205 [Candidatus Sumerlaeaceae bacterium]
MKRVQVATIVLFFGALVPVIQAQPAGTQPAQHHEHVHHAPHGGKLVVLADEFVNLELVIDHDAGKLTGYVLDDHAENPVRISQKEILLDLNSIRGKSTTATLALKAVDNALTGERVGSTSEFSGPLSVLKGAKQFKGTIREVSAKGSTFKKVPVTFP